MILNDPESMCDAAAWHLINFKYTNWIDSAHVQVRILDAI